MKLSFMSPPRTSVSTATQNASIGATCPRHLVRAYESSDIETAIVRIVKYVTTIQSWMASSRTRRRCHGSGPEPRDAAPALSTEGVSVRKAFSGIGCKKSVGVYLRAAPICQTDRAGARKDSRRYGSHGLKVNDCR